MVFFESRMIQPQEPGGALRECAMHWTLKQDVSVEALALHRRRRQASPFEPGAGFASLARADARLFVQ